MVKLLVKKKKNRIINTKFWMVFFPSQSRNMGFGRNTYSFISIK